ncbi:MAG: acetyltransferase, partial [Burkholderiales bacterium]
NYNSYGETIDDLHISPARLYSRLIAYRDPLAYVGESRDFGKLRTAMHDDLALAESHPAQPLGPGSAAAFLPEQSWSRRVVGVYANLLAKRAPGRAHAVLVRKSGGYMVSIRAPIAKPTGAVGVARAFASGGGREGAAGIDFLPDAQLDQFMSAMRRAFAG